MWLFYSWAWLRLSMFHVLKMCSSQRKSLILWLCCHHHRPSLRNPDNISRTLACTNKKKVCKNRVEIGNQFLSDWEVNKGLQPILYWLLFWTGHCNLCRILWFWFWPQLYICLKEKSFSIFLWYFLPDSYHKKKHCKILWKY